MKHLLIGSCAAAALALGSLVALAQTAAPGGAGSAAPGASAPVGGAGAGGGAGAPSGGGRSGASSAPLSPGGPATQGGPAAVGGPSGERGAAAGAGAGSAPGGAAGQGAGAANPRDRDGGGAAQRGGEGAGQRGAGASGGVNITTQQRTTIRETIVRGGVAPVTNVNFAVTVGTAIPASVTYHELPPTIVEIVPQYRGYRYIRVRDDILIIDPATRRIVYVIEG